MIRFRTLTAHSTTALTAGAAAALITLYTVNRNGSRREPDQPTPQAINAAFEKLSSPLAIKFSEVSSPALDGQGLALLQSKRQAQDIANSSSSSDAEKKVARYIDDIRTRQLETQATTHSGTRLINGKPAPPNGFQYQVAIVFAGSDSPLYGLHCGGTLIDPKWVLTAAHCFNPDTQNTDFQVFVGSRKLSDGGRLVSIARIIRNQYDPKTNEKDVALVELSVPVTDQAIIPLAAASIEANRTTRIATISGWGVTTEGSSMASDDLQFAFVPTIDHKTCQTAYAKLPLTARKDISDDMVCAGDGHADSCQGDSGGPLVIKSADNKPYVEGVVSWGEGCNSPRFPGVYARVPSYLDWINSSMR